VLSDDDGDTLLDNDTLLDTLPDVLSDDDTDALAVVLALADRDALPLADGDADGDMLLLRDPVKDTSEEVGVMERDGETDAEDDKVGVGDGDTDGYHGT
jgi:hypothetical protein